MISSFSLRSPVSTKSKTKSTKHPKSGPIIEVFLQPGTPAANLVRLAAEFSSVSLSITKRPDGERSPVRLALPSSPVVALTHPVPAAQYVASLAGKTRFSHGLTFPEEASIVQWSHFARDDAHSAVGAFAADPEGPAAREQALHLMDRVNFALRHRTFLSGERLSLADCAVAAEVLPLCLASRDCDRERFPHLVRWVNTCIHQKEFISVYGEIPRLF